MKKNILKCCLVTALIFSLFSCANESTAGKYTTSENDWLDESVPSFCETYKDLIPYTGFAVEYGSGTEELRQSVVQNGLAKHANTITMGNDFKPDFIMAWWGTKPNTNGTFKATNGITIKTPELVMLPRLVN